MKNKKRHIAQSDMPKKTLQPEGQGARKTKTQKTNRHTQSSAEHFKNTPNPSTAIQAALPQASRVCHPKPPNPQHRYSGALPQASRVCHPKPQHRYWHAALLQPPRVHACCSPPKHAWWGATRSAHHGVRPLTAAAAPCGICPGSFPSGLAACAARCRYAALLPRGPRVLAPAA